MKILHICNDYCGSRAHGTYGLARTYNNIHAREGVSCVLPKDCRQLTDVVEGDVDEAVGFAVWFGSPDILNGEVSTPAPDGSDALFRGVDETVERTQVGIDIHLQWYNVFLKHNQQRAEIFLKHNQQQVEIFLKHNQDKTKFLLKYNQRRVKRH